MLRVPALLLVLYMYLKFVVILFIYVHTRRRAHLLCYSALSTAFR